MTLSAAKRAVPDGIPEAGAHRPGRSAAIVPGSPEARRLWAASEELEGLFVTQLVKASQMAAGSMFANVPGGGVMQGLAEEAFGKALAESADFGVATGLFRDLGGGARPPAALTARAPSHGSRASLVDRATRNAAQPARDPEPAAPHAAGSSRAARLVDRLAPFADAIAEASERFGVDANLIRAVIARESGGNPSARSPKGARGLMQIVPATGRALGLARPFDPRENVLAGTRYLAEMLERHGGDLPLALASYNAGPGAVARHGGIPPYRETLRYVSDVLGVFQSLQGPYAEASAP